MRRRRWSVLAFAVGMGVAFGGPLGSSDAKAGYPGDAPYQPSYPLDDTRPNTARLIVPDREHPEVEVSRSLAAQPVHPWMARVFIGDQVTLVDPHQPLRKSDNRGLDEGHSLMRAQRLHNQLTGVTSTDLAAISHERTSRPAGGNQAILMTAPQR